MEPPPLWAHQGQASERGQVIYIPTTIGQPLPPPAVAYADGRLAAARGEAAVGMESYASLKLCDCSLQALCDFNLCVRAKTELVYSTSPYYANFNYAIS